MFARKKVKAHVEPALVGLGMVLAGAPSMPQLTEVMGEVAIEQGRIDEEGKDMRGFDMGEDDVAPGTLKRADQSNALEDVDSGENSDGEALTPVTPANEVSSPGDMQMDRTYSFDRSAVIPPRRLKRNTTPSAAQTSPALPIHIINIRRSRMSEDPLGQADQPAPVFSHAPSQSSPSISVLKPSKGYVADALLSRYDLPAQVHLLRSHYCRSEVCSFMTHNNHALIPGDSHFRCSSY
jgi:phosphatidylinositol 4-kinase B